MLRTLSNNTHKMLSILVNNMPTANVRLCEVKDAKIDEAPSLSLPISDHDIIVGANKHGVFATWNMLNPDSPVSPGFVPASIKGLRRIYHEEERNEHIIKTVDMIVSLMVAGVDAIALQEVPAKNDNNPYFESFVVELKRKAHLRLNIDFEAFEESYMQTKKPVRNGVEQGYHGFATALLFKKNSFILNNVVGINDGRGASYLLRSQKSNEDLTLVNVHGDYGKANQLAEYIALESKNPNTIVLGDTNIPLTNKEAVEKFKTMNGVVIEPSMNVAETSEDSRTLDCFVTSMNMSYIHKSDCKNYANSESDTFTSAVSLSYRLISGNK